MHQHHSDPFTRQPLQLDQLIPLPALQAEIRAFIAAQNVSDGACISGGAAAAASAAAGNASRGTDLCASLVPADAAAATSADEAGALPQPALGAGSARCRGDTGIHAQASLLPQDVEPELGAREEAVEGAETEAGAGAGVEEGEEAEGGSGASSWRSLWGRLGKFGRSSWWLGS